MNVGKNDWARVLKFFEISIKQPGVDFIKVGRKAQIIEIALSKLGAQHKERPTPLKSFSKVWRRARIGRKKFLKSTPNLHKKTIFCNLL